MDLLSHGLLGAATAQAFASKAEVRIASGVGFGAALLADVDALARSATDPLLFLEYHRHFTHSLVFIPVGALVAALLLWPFLRRRLAFARLYLFAFLGYALAGVLDACTSYGTHLLWPFSDARTSWSIIAIVDPTFTALLALPVISGVIRHRPAAGRIALMLATAYLAFGAAQHQRALGVTWSLAEQRGHVPELATVKPTMGNLVLWRSLYVAEGTVHVDAVRVGWFAGDKIYPGESATLVRPDAVSAAPAGSRMRRDIERFSYFSDDLLTYHPDDPDVIGDARYAMLPTSMTPLWAIRVDAERPDEHVEFIVDRTLTPRQRQRFIGMLLGRERAATLDRQRAPD
jgi:inner membrane protein